MNGDKQQPDLFTLILTSVGAEITAFKFKTRKICNEDDDSLTDSITQRVMNAINEYNGNPQPPTPAPGELYWKQRCLLVEECYQKLNLSEEHKKQYAEWQQLKNQEVEPGKQ